MKVWFITGASRGLGRAIAEEALSRGDRIIATARNPDDLTPLTAIAPDRVLALKLDVTDEDAAKAAAKAGEEWSGGIDILLNNAGHGMHGAVEEVSGADVRRIFDVNVFGLLAVTRAVMPGMRARGRGRIVNLSSIAGLMGSAGSGIYSATKFAVEGLSESIAAEAGPLGISVTLVEPGPFRTDFNGDSVMVAGGTIADYEETSTRRTEALRAGSGRQPGDPVKAAILICDALEEEDPPLHLVIGRTALARLQTKLDKLNADVERWRARSEATDFDDAAG